MDRLLFRSDCRTKWRTWVATRSLRGRTRMLPAGSDPHKYAKEKGRRSIPTRIANLKAAFRGRNGGLKTPRFPTYVVEAIDRSEGPMS